MESAEFEIENTLSFKQQDYIFTTQSSKITTFNPDYKLFIEAEHKLTG